MMCARATGGALEALVRLIREGTIGKKRLWLRFVKQPISKYTSTYVEVVILPRRHKRFLSFFQKLRFLVSV
jgi:hypothetical protein